MWRGYHGWHVGWPWRRWHRRRRRRRWPRQRQLHRRRPRPWWRRHWRGSTGSALLGERLAAWRQPRDRSRGGGRLRAAAAAATAAASCRQPHRRRNHGCAGRGVGWLCPAGSSNHWLPLPFLGRRWCHKRRWWQSTTTNAPATHCAAQRRLSPSGAARLRGGGVRGAAGVVVRVGDAGDAGDAGGARAASLTQAATATASAVAATVAVVLFVPQRLQRVVHRQPVPRHRRLCRGGARRAAAQARPPRVVACQLPGGAGVLGVRRHDGVAEAGVTLRLRAPRVAAHLRIQRRPLARVAPPRLPGSMCNGNGGRHGGTARRAAGPHRHQRRRHFAGGHAWLLRRRHRLPVPQHQAV